MHQFVQALARPRCQQSTHRCRDFWCWSVGKNWSSPLSPQNSNDDQNNYRHVKRPHGRRRGNGRRCRRRRELGGKSGCILGRAPGIQTKKLCGRCVDFPVNFRGRQVFLARQFPPIVSLGLAGAGRTFFPQPFLVGSKTVGKFWFTCPAQKFTTVLGCAAIGAPRFRPPFTPRFNVWN